jgi:hypothetical protein
MMGLDWKNLDWAELAKSNIARGAAVILVTGAFKLSGITPDSTTTSHLVDQILNIVMEVAGVWVMWQRVKAQPETVAVILPKKEVLPSTPPS